MIYLGIDTSCYTTSVAAVSESGSIICEARKLLNVPEGQRGLRQSEAFYQHVNALPDLYEKVIQKIENRPLKAIAVSAHPRGCADSYMPVFYAGVRMAEMIAKTAGVPLYQTDHQQGHIVAALSNAGLDFNNFLAVHLSGGTTEVLAVTGAAPRLKCKILYGTSDISAGQLIDRVGVAMGFSFPAGRYVDEMAVNMQGNRILLPTYIDSEKCSFSGTEAAAMRALAKNIDNRVIAEGVMNAICKTIARLIYNSALKTGIMNVLVTGGVASSNYLRANLQTMISEHSSSIRVFFAEPRLSSDNAVGVAQIARAYDQLKNN